MSEIDELNSEYGFTFESPQIGSIEEREAALNAADLPSLVPGTLSDTSPFVPPLETPSSIPTGISKTPSIPKPVAGPAPAPGSIYQAALKGLGRGPTSIEAENANLGIPQVPAIPTEIKPSSIDEANRNLMFGPSLKLGETRDTQVPGFLIPSTKEEITLPPTEPVKKGIITEAIHAPIYGVAQLGQIAAGLTAVAGEALKSDAITNIARDAYDKATKFMEPYAPTVGDIRQIGGVGDAVHWAISSIGQMLPFMIGTMGAGGAISKIITTTLGQSIVKKAAASAIAKGWAEASVKDAMGKALADLGMKAGYAGMAAASIGAETGIIASDRLTNGIKVLSSDLLWAIPAGFLDVLPEWRLAAKMNLFGGRIASIVSREGLESAKSSFIKEFGKQAFLEGITEGWQEILEEAGAGRKAFTYDTMWQAINAFMAAGLAGGVMGAGTNLFVKTPTAGVGGPTERQGPVNVPPGIPPFSPELAKIGERVYGEKQLLLPGAQGFNLISPEKSVLRKAWNVPAENAPEIFTKQEGRFRPVGQGPVEEMPGARVISEYQDLLTPKKGEGFIMLPPTVEPTAAIESAQSAQNIFNTEEWAPLREFWNKLVMGKSDTPSNHMGWKISRSPLI